MSFYIFKIDTGEYQGIRLTPPTDQEPNLIGIEHTPETIAQMSKPFEHILVDGQIVEGDPLPKPVPFEVPVWKLRYVLEQLGLENSVSAAIEQLDEPMRGAAIKLWNFGNSVERNSPTVSLIKQILTIDDAQADQIFINADSIVL